ncbi:MAG: class I SAM-dependent methyltransferase [Ktedonobacterales bacterium]
MKFEEIYISGTYLDINPTWHVEKSPWKAQQIMKMLARHGLAPETICDVGCGAGEILAQLQREMPEDCSFVGYEISPQAVALAKSRENGRLHFKLGDVSQLEGYFDLILVIDVIEHVEDCFNFIRELQPKSQYKIFHISLDLTVESLLRTNALLGFRNTRGHIGHVHYFTKDIALAMLEDLGYDVLDYFYTKRPLRATDSFKRKMVQLPRQVAFSLRQDLAVRVLGGYNLLVLAH